MTPVMIQDSVSVAANTTVENLIALNTGAQRYIRAPFNAIGVLYVAVSALTAPGVRVELIVDGKTILDSSDARVPSAAAILLKPDDVVVEQFFVRQGAQLVLRAVNGTGGALTVYYRFEMAEAESILPVCRYTQRFQSIAANTTVQIMTGLRFERPLMDSLLTIFAAASAAGLLVELFVDGNSVAPAMPVPARNAMPTNPYDTLIDGVEVQKDALIEIRVQNTTGGALSFFWRTHLQEMQVQAG